MDRDALIGEVAAAVRGCQRSAEALDDAVATRLAINRTDLRHLELLADGPLSAGQLSDRSGLSPAAMTALIDRLERKGYVRRIRDAADRRRVFVELTDRSREAGCELYGPLVSEGRELLGGYTAEQLTMMRDFLCADRRLNEQHHDRIAAE